MTTKERAEKTYCVYDKIRSDKGLTDYAVATKAGITPSTLSDWKNGLYTPKMEKLSLIASVLEVPLMTFVIE